MFRVVYVIIVMVPRGVQCPQDAILKGTHYRGIEGEVE